MASSRVRGVQAPEVVDCKPLVGREVEEVVQQRLVGPVEVGVVAQEDAHVA